VRTPVYNYVDEDV